MKSSKQRIYRIGIVTAILILAGMQTIGVAGGYFCEDFESIESFPSTDWNYHTCYNPDLVPGIDPVNGHPDHCYVPGGAGHGQNTEIYHNSFLADYSGGLTMACDFFIGDAGSHYTDLAIGLPRIPIENGVNLLYSVAMHFNSNAGTRNLLCVLDSDDPDHMEMSVLESGFSAAHWSHVRISIRPDQFVEFYLDDTLIFTSTKTIDPAYNFAAPILHGFNANPVFADNFCVGPYEPAEPTPTPTATPTGPTVTPMPVLPHAMSFPGGSGDMVTIPDSDNLSFTGGSFTIEFWVFPRAIEDNCLVSKWGEGPTSVDDEYLVQMTETGQINFSLCGIGNWFPSTGTVETGHWYHIACVFDAALSTGTIYINGQNAGSDTLSALNYNTSIPFRVGGYTVAPVPFDGNIDMIRLSDCSRYTGAFEPPCELVTDANTRGLWQFDEGAGSIIHDDSAYGHHGTRAGNTTYLDNPDYCDIPSTCTPTLTPTMNPPTDTPTSIPTASPTDVAPTETCTPVPTPEPTANCWDMSDQTYAMYHFEQNADDQGPYGYHGTAHGGLWSDDAVCGTYAYQNQRSSSNYLELPTAILNTIGSSWAIRAHLKLAGHGSNGNELTFLCHKNGINDHDVCIAESPDWTDCSLYTNLESIYSLCIDGLTTGIYYVYELRYSDSDGYARVYLDGILQDEVYIGHSPLSQKSTLYIGKGMFGNENRPWWGNIDHLEFLSLDGPATPTTTATPSPTSPPTASPTDVPPTETCTPTMNPPTDTPTSTPTASPTAVPPTETCTPVPTHTPTATPSATCTADPPTPTPTPEDPIRVTLILPADHFYGGDDFYLYCRVEAFSADPITGRLFVIMDLHGEAFWFPTWGQFRWFELMEHGLEEWSVQLTVFDETTEIIIQTFEMPFIPFESTHNFFMATFTDSDVTYLMSNVDYVEWGYGGEKH